MATTYDGRSGTANEAESTRAGVAPAEALDGTHPPHADATARPDHRAAEPPTAGPHSGTPPPTAGAPAHPWRKWLLRAGVVVGLAAGGYALIPYVETMLNTVSTDDAYVNGHVTFVAPRVSGLVSRVLVDDNYRVKKGGPAGPARQGAVPSPGRHQDGGRGQCRGRRGGRPVPGAGHPGVGPEPAMEAPEVDGGRRRHGRTAPGPGRGPAEQGGDPRPRQGRLRPRQGHLQPQRAVA
jgi:Biotin-lipoyl like